MIILAASSMNNGIHRSEFFSISYGDEYGQIGFIIPGLIKRLDSSIVSTPHHGNKPNNFFGLSNSTVANKLTPLVAIPSEFSPLARLVPSTRNP